MKALCVFANAVVWFCLSTGTVQAQAQTLYGVTFQPAKLITINITTGAGTLVGNLNPAFQAAGLAFRGAKLYVLDMAGRKIVEIDPATGATIATLDIGAPAASFGEGDIAFRSDGVGFMTGFSPAPLTQFDVTVPSSISLGAPAPTIEGLSFNAAGVLYGVTESTGQLHTINQVTGFATLVGPTGVPGTNASGLAFDRNGNLFATFDMAPANTPLYQVNPATGAAVLIGNTGFPVVAGLAFQGGAAGGSGSEGSYGGSSGGSSRPTGVSDEGSFGYGGRSRRFPTLLGPFLDQAGETVFNVSYRQETQAEVPQELGPPAWAMALITILGVAAVLGLVKIVGN